MHNRRFVLRSDRAALYGAADLEGVAAEGDPVDAAGVRLAVCRVAVGVVLPAGVDVVVGSLLMGWSAERKTVPDPGRILDRNFSTTSSFVS